MINEGLGQLKTFLLGENRQLSAKNIALRLVSTPYPLAILVYIVFLAANWIFYGPAYLSDEVAYLNKAATIAGQTVHVDGSWFGGYSILISPAYFLSHNPYIEWKIILVLNAAMWAVTTVLLFYVLKQLRPKASTRAVTFATAGSLLYPAWISMSGYAFATSGFVLILMASLAFLVKSKLTRGRWLLGSGVFGGYLFWVHPLGGVYLGLLLALFATVAIIHKHWKFVVAPVATVAVALTYVYVVSPTLNYLMRSNDNTFHYTRTFTNIIHTVLTLGFWERFGVLSASLLFSVIIATFGIIAFAADDGIRGWVTSKLSWRKKVVDPVIIVPILLLVSVIGVIGVNAVSTASNAGGIRLDEWVYGRYTDMFILPLIGLGLLAKWRPRVILASIAFVVFAGVLLAVYTNPHNTDFTANNKVNIEAFWPMFLTSFVHIRDYLVWGILGAGAIVITYFAAKTGKKTVILALIPIILLTNGANLLYHYTILTDHSTVSSLYSYVKDHYAPNQCIGFSPQIDSLERFSLYSYYLHGYNVQQMSMNDWINAKCTGPYFSYNSDINMPGVFEKGTDKTVGLLMFVRAVSTPGSLLSFH
jgi:hypothetical protein